MNRKVLIAVVAIAAIVVFPMLAAGGGGKCQRHYDTATVEDFSGEVIEVIEQDCKGCNVKGVHIKVKGEKETMTIALGPAWYVDNQETKIKVKDEIEVHGSRTKVHDEIVIIAQKIVRGDDVFVLRDEKGFPKWAGWKRGKTS